MCCDPTVLVFPLKDFLSTVVDSMTVSTITFRKFILHRLFCEEEKQEKEKSD